MTIRAVVRGVGHYLPERVVPNSELEAKVDTSDEWIRSRSGIERRHFAGEDELQETLENSLSARYMAEAVEVVAPLFPHETRERFRKSLEALDEAADAAED